MGSGKKGGGKISGKYPVSKDDKMMMIQGLGEMNIDDCDSGDWLMINNESGVKAWNHPQVSANQGPKPWGQPGMLNQHPKSWSQGQPPMLGRPRGHDQVSWGNFHPTPSADYVPRPPPPNFVNNNYNGMMARNPVGMPPWSNGQGFNARGGFDGTKPNGGGKRPLDVDDDSDDDYEDEDEEESYSGSKAKNVTKSKTPTKGVTSNSWVPPGVGSQPYMNRGHGPSVASHPGVGYYGWRPAGGGMLPPLPVPHFPPPQFPPHQFPPPPFPSAGKFSAGDKKISSEKTGKNIPKMNSFDGGNGTKFDDDDFDDEFDDEDFEDEFDDEDTHKNGSDRVVGRMEHLKLNPQPGMPPPGLKHTLNLTNGGGSSQKQAYCNPPYNNGKKSIVPRDAAEENSQNHFAMEAYRKKPLPPPFLSEGKPPNNSNPISGATSFKTGAKNAGKNVEILSESDSTDFDDDEESEIDDDANAKVVARPEFVSGKSEKSKHVEVNFAVKQISKLPKDAKKEVMQSRKHHKEQCGEDTDDCADEQLRMKAEKCSEQSNVHVSFFEDYKNRVKEVAKLVKFHITPKHEGDTCAADKEQLMKLHEEKLEMKKRHQKEEQELEKQFTAALRRFMEKQTSVDADSDASSEL